MKHKLFKKMITNRILSVFLSLLIATGVLFVTGATPVSASDTIYLGSEGWSVPVGTWDSATQTAVLTQDLSSSIEITSNYIILDGNGHTISGDGSGDGVYAESKHHLTIRNLTINGKQNGVKFYKTHNSIVENNTISNTERGIYLYEAALVSVLNNQTFDSSMAGISIRAYSVQNSITGNEVHHNTIGIWLEGPFYTTIRSNDIRDNDVYGLAITDDIAFVGGELVSLRADHNQIYNNNFINNTTQASVNYMRVGDNNTFNLEAPVGGNYWSNWTSPDEDHDGFVDNPYSFYGGTDNLPWAFLNGWLPSENQPPEAIIDTGVDVYNGTEGGPAVVFNAHESYDPDGDPLTYRWDFNNDGIWDTGYLTDAGYAYIYPDDYAGLVVLEVSDGELTDTDTCEVLILNVPPIVDMLADQIYPSPPILASVGDSVHVFAAFKDAPADMHTYLWDFGDGGSEPGTVPEPEPSPPIIKTDHIYAAPGVYMVTLTVTDDDGGTGEDWIEIIVNTSDAEIGTIGFWKHQIGGSGNQHIDNDILEGYINFIDSKSKVFSEKTPLGGLADAESLLWLKKATMEQRATQQLLATWLNVANGAIGMDDMVDTDSDGNVDMKLKDAIKLAENIILDPTGDYEQAKDICDSINNM